MNTKHYALTGKGRRLVPTEPLRAYIRKTYPGKQYPYIANILGTSHGSVQKLMTANDVMLWNKADKYAIRLGLHPVLIWEDWYELTALPGELELV